MMPASMAARDTCGKCRTGWRGVRPGGKAFSSDSQQGCRRLARIAIASDHAAFALKGALVAWARGQGHHVADLGPESDAPVDYPDFGYRLAGAIERGEAEFGVALCGSGIGIAIAVNRSVACRCALVSEPLSARLARTHNDANVIAMGARLIGPDMAIACLTAFLAAEFAGGRHAGRVAKLSHVALQEEPA